MNTWNMSGMLTVQWLKKMKKTYKQITMKVKAKAPYFMSVTRNNTWDRQCVHFTLALNTRKMVEKHKATWKGKKLIKVLRSRIGIELKTSRTKGRMLTECANNRFLSHDWLAKISWDQKKKSFPEIFLVFTVFWVSLTVREVPRHSNIVSTFN